MQGGGGGGGAHRAQAYFRLKEVRPYLFFGVTPEMEGPNFYSSNDDYDDDDDDDNGQGEDDKNVNGE